MEELFMKILEFIQVVNNNKAKLYNKADKNDLQNFIKQTLNIKSYISIKEKKWVFIWKNRCRRTKYQRMAL